MEDEIVRGWIGFLRRVLSRNVKIIRLEALVGDGAVRPDLPFVGLKIISGPDDIMAKDKFGFDERGVYNQYTAKKFSVIIISYGEDAMSTISTIKSESQLSDHIDFLRSAAGISITSRGPTTDASVQRETGFDRRYSMSFDFIVGLTIPVTAEVIETANVEQVNGN